MWRGKGLRRRKWRGRDRGGRARVSQGRRSGGERRDLLVYLHRQPAGHTPPPFGSDRLGAQQEVVGWVLLFPERRQPLVGGLELGLLVDRKEGADGGRLALLTMGRHIGRALRRERRRMMADKAAEARRQRFVDLGDLQDELGDIGLELAE